MQLLRETKLRVRVEESPDFTRNFRGRSQAEGVLQGGRDAGDCWRQTVGEFRSQEGGDEPGPLGGVDGVVGEGCVAFQGAAGEVGVPEEEGEGDVVEEERGDGDVIVGAVVGEEEGGVGGEDGVELEGGVVGVCDEVQAGRAVAVDDLLAEAVQQAARAWEDERGVFADEGGVEWGCR